MAFLQTDLPPSTAPVRTRPTMPRARRPMPFAKIARPRIFTLARVATATILATAAAVPGYAAYIATESLALAVLAADFSFLLGIAARSAVSRG